MEGIEDMSKEEFKLPEGYKAWCHDCGLPPFSKSTVVPSEIENIPQELAEIGLEPQRKMIAIPGLGFKTLDEHTEHIRNVHRVWKG